MAIPREPQNPDSLHRQRAALYDEVLNELLMREQRADNAMLNEFGIMKIAGKALERVNTVERMLRKSFSPEITADCFELPLDRVQRIAQLIMAEGT